MNIGCTDDLHGTDIVLFENSAGQEVEQQFYGPGLSCNKFTDTWFWRKTDPMRNLQEPSGRQQDGEVLSDEY